ncbi:phosphatidylinositol 3,4,5-trisphosphate 3-phosphatase TPTE2-like [Perognathus longimembris pacificus]|uniref:phosphatidylinositol 3,4,5-trisphosphate 3-phosphatase TPTE2-like n=1 Tax=Perognathus longimembris pacificus TaxID=214514 RepID=UPI00201A0865|nr:phosphatidylinositol 3,4,5-trisphosphate 3-phosphatase TPTE2-like [Perognathus longimembris pacificus]
MPPFWKQTGSPRALEAACQGLAARRSRWAVRAPRWTRLSAVYGTSRWGSLQCEKWPFRPCQMEDLPGGPADGIIQQLFSVLMMPSSYTDMSIQELQENTGTSGAAGQNRVDCGLQAVVVESKEDSINGTCEHEVCPAHNDDNMSERDDCGLQAVVVEFKEDSIDGNIPSDTTIEIEEWNNNNERILEILLIFIDLALMGTDVVITMTKLSIALEYRAVSFVIALFFLLDVVLQIYVKGMAVFFRLLRLITFVRIFHLANQTRYLENLIRRLVSGNKRRYAKDGFDLDLTYITERLIAMSFPSSGKHAVYRNPMEEVVHFLDTRHPEHYFVYNLCSERSYDPRFFHHRMHRILIDDHNVPTLQEMISFSKEVIAWLSKDPQNTIAIHCKGGKGRTGTMICVCLLAMDTFSTAKESLTYFGERRTDKRFCDKFQGVETPSQSRYVGYFETIKTMWNWELPVKKTLTITKIVLYSIKGNGKDLTIDIIMQHKTVFTCTGQTCEVSHDIETNRAIFIVPNCPALCDDIKLKFTSKNLPNHYENCAFFFWCNVSLIEKNRSFVLIRHLEDFSLVYTVCFSRVECRSLCQALCRRHTGVAAIRHPEIKSVFSNEQTISVMADMFYIIHSSSNVQPLGSGNMMTVELKC